MSPKLFAAMTSTFSKGLLNGCQGKTLDYCRLPHGFKLQDVRNSPTPVVKFSLLFCSTFALSGTSLLVSFLLPPELGPRRSLNSMILNEVREELKLTPRTSHTPVLGGRSPRICVGNFDLFSFSFWFASSACVSLMFWDTERPYFLLISLFAVDLLPSFSFLVIWQPARCHGTWNTSFRSTTGLRRRLRTAASQPMIFPSLQFCRTL